MTEHNSILNLDSMTHACKVLHCFRLAVNKRPSHRIAL